MAVGAQHRVRSRTRSWWTRAALVAVSAVLAAGFQATAARAAPGQPFLELQSPFTQALYGTAPDFLGGIAFAPNGDVWADTCAFSGGQLHRFIRDSAEFQHGTVIHTRTTVDSNAGCGLTNHPDGRLYSNTANGLARLDATTGAPIDTVGAPGNVLGITVDPKTAAVAYVGADCRGGGACTIERYDPATGTQSHFAELTATDATFVDGITFDPSGDHLLLATRSPSYRLTILDRDGKIIQSIPMSTEPDGISFHGTEPSFVVTNNTDGTMTRFDFPGNDLTKEPTQSSFASGGFRGDLSLVGADGCIYLTQAGTRFLDGTTTAENSVVQICPGFTPSPGVDPEQFVYVAVGDSYSSGEGAPPFEDGKNYPAAVKQENTLTYGAGANGCHRSLTNYAKLNAAILQPDKSSLLVDRTCSGADIVPDAESSKGPIVPTPETAGRTDSQVQQALDRLDDDFGGRTAGDVDLVSATMGGNDAGFGDLIQACLIPNIASELFRAYSETPGEIEWVVSQFGTCKNLDALFFHTGDKTKKLKDLELAAQPRLAETFPNARVLQLTYPSVVPDKSAFAGDSCGGVLRRDAAYVRDKAQDIDDAIRAAGKTTAADTGDRFQVVDVQHGFGANALCPADPSKALANGVDQQALSAVINGLVAEGTESRRLIDDLSQRWKDLRNCVLSRGRVGILGALTCKGRLDDVKAALDRLKGYFTPDTIRTLVGGLAAGDTEEQRFDNSRLLFHPNAVGVGVMGCNLAAVYQRRSPDTCTPDLGGVLTYLFNGVNLSTTQPQVLTPGAPVPFQFNGFDPGTPVLVNVFSDSVDLGTFTVDGAGAAAGTITLPPDLSPGVHRLEFVGTNNKSPRTIQVLVRIDGSPRGGADYGLYFSGFTGDDEVKITYGGLDWGTKAPDEDGGVFVEVPLPEGDLSGIQVRVTGTTTNKVAAQEVAPSKPGGPRCTIRGTAGNDRLVGTRGRDVICGRGGNDRLLGLGGNDVLRGGTGKDVLIGGAGDDRLIGDSGDDLLAGGAGEDVLFGRAGDDRLNGHAGNDVLAGGTGDDTLVGGAGDDRMTGHAGNDVLHGRSGADMLSGGEGHDWLAGGPGKDTLSGGPARDRCDGDGEVDTARGCEVLIHIP
jgi:RTX calcium-binding nonapeptide repeat (4 copies)